jgi:hypothetical protein
MAVSEVQICNVALGRIGQSIFIDALTERSQAASVCNLFFEPCRDRALADGLWDFATTRVVLADLGANPVNWSYRYALPSDFLAAQYLVIPGIRTPRADQRIPYRLATEGEQRVLYTDLPQAELVYTRRVTNPSLFSPQFNSALSWLIASEIALPLSATPKLAGNAAQMYQIEIAQAQAASLNQHQDDREPESEFITGRN